MPRYLYRCTSCDKISTIFHLSDETVEECPECKMTDSLIKSLTSFTTAPAQKRPTRVGDTTEEFIQEARTDLHKQKKELKDNR